MSSSFLDGAEELVGRFGVDDELLAGFSGMPLVRDFCLGLDGGLFVLKNLGLVFEGEGCDLGGLGGGFLLFTDLSVTSNPSCTMEPGTGRRGPMYRRNVSSTP